ncbi:hypothetical protein F5Y11DRAFT_353795 [Daldinia sp. FL1419]|nr:hypothetical protein F5Y11DRAFT_353795 [Daldinia sp. FL1419]
MGSQRSCKGSRICVVKKSLFAAPLNLIQLVEDEAAVTGPLYGCRCGLDIDIGRILSWLQSRRNEHDNNCSAAFLKVNRRPIPILMIDVVDKYLRSADTGVQCYALKSSEVDAFNRVALLRTIKDAIDITVALINAIDAIYSQASLTLVVATGDSAHSDLSGWSKESREEIQEFTATIASDLRIGTAA